MLKKKNYILIIMKMGEYREYRTTAHCRGERYVQYE